MPQPKRKCNPELQLIAKPSRRIVLPIDQMEYKRQVQDRRWFRQWVDRMYEQHPELFPHEFSEGYYLHDLRASKKMSEVYTRRIRLKSTGTVYRIVPSFVLPYMTGYAVDVEKALFLRRFGVPFWGLTYVFGRDDMYWQRLVTQLGRYDLVGTTVKDPDRLPEHLLADEKFTAMNGTPLFVATTVGDDVILGAATSASAQADDLTIAYGEFKQEATRLHPDYHPITVNMDGWKQTRQAWRTLFPMIAVLRCFLHAFLQVRNWCRRSPHFSEVRHLIWRSHHARSAHEYRRCMRDVIRFARLHLAGKALEAAEKFYRRRRELLQVRRYPGAHAVSTMLERHMQPMARCLYMARDFHGHRDTAHLMVRGWTLLHNFLPYCPRTRTRSGTPYVSPFHKLNQTLYCECWLQNLLVATSCQQTYFRPTSGEKCRFHQFR